jgi:RNA polymerase sigma-70 factor (ECF subfamily)
MFVYSSNMILSIPKSKTAVFRMTSFIHELVLFFAEAFVVADGNEEADRTVSAELEDIRRSRQGDSDAYRRLIERHQGHVGKILWRFSRDRQVHEELVQDVFVEAYMSLRSYRGKAPFAHWLSRIATRVGYRYWKQVARLLKTESFSLEEWDRIPDKSSQDMDPVEAASLVHRLLGQLQPRDRLVLTLRYLEGLDVETTAQRTGWTKSMVKVQTWRAKKRLEKLLEQAEREVLK